MDRRTRMSFFFEAATFEANAFGETAYWKPS
jgi:hypothetical protein